MCVNVSPYNDLISTISAYIYVYIIVSITCAFYDLW